MKKIHDLSPAFHPPRAAVLVTGGAGFIGSNLVERLLRRGDRVTVLDNFSTGFLENLRPFLRDIRLVRGDVRRPRDVRNAMRGVRIVFHEAAVRSVAKSVEDPFHCHGVNATGTLILLEEALRARVDRVVYASTSAVYGDVQKFPQSETDTLKPLSPYGATKLLGEHYAYSYSVNRGLSTVALRYFNVYGPRQNPESKYSTVVPAFIDRLKKGKTPLIDGTGKQARDFVYVGDVVEANLRAAFGPDRISGEVFNVASGSMDSVLDVLRILAKHMGKKPRPVFGPRRPGDAMKTRADIRKARQLLKWRPKMSFDGGLRETVRWFEGRHV